MIKINSFSKPNHYLFLAILTIFIGFSYPLKAEETISEAGYNYFAPITENGQKITLLWNSSDGIKRLENSKYKNDYYQLVGFFQPQINPLYCGIASSVIILNALKSEKNEIESDKAIQVLTPTSMSGNIIPYKSYSQITFLNEQTDKIKKREVIELQNAGDDEEFLDPGLSLDQLSQILSEVYNLKIKTTHVEKVDNKELNQFRETLKAILNDKNQFILANFYGKVIGTNSAGHISPLVAYDQGSDSVLVMDVAAHQRSWFWVKTDYLYKAMNTKDGSKYRGYIIVSNPDKKS